MSTSPDLPTPPAPAPRPPAEVATIAQASQLRAQMLAAGSAPYVVVPPGMRVEDVEHLRLTPARRKGIFHTADKKSFSEWIGRYRTPGTVLCYAPEEVGVLAMIDYHFAGPPSDESPNGWGDFVAVLECAKKDRDKVLDEMARSAQVPAFKGVIDRL